MQFLQKLPAWFQGCSFRDDTMGNTPRGIVKAIVAYSQGRKKAAVNGQGPGGPVEIRGNAQGGGL